MSSSGNSDIEKHSDHDSKSVSSSEPEVAVDPEMEKKVWRKLDMYVLPIVAMFYLLSFLVGILSSAVRFFSDEGLGSDECCKCSCCWTSNGTWDV